MHSKCSSGHFWIYLWGQGLGANLQMQTHFVPKILHQNLTVILRQLYNGNVNFIAFSPCLSSFICLSLSLLHTILSFNICTYLYLTHLFFLSLSLQLHLSICVSISHIPTYSLSLFLSSLFLSLSLSLSLITLSISLSLSLSLSISLKLTPSLSHIPTYSLFLYLFFLSSLFLYLSLCLFLSLLSFFLSHILTYPLSVFLSRSFPRERKFFETFDSDFEMN